LVSFPFIPQSISYIIYCCIQNFVLFLLLQPIGLGKIATFINAGKIDSSELITMKTLKVFVTASSLKMNLFASCAPSHSFVYYYYHTQDAGVLGKQIKDGVRLMGRGSEKIQWPIHLEVCIL
jgi:large subunit ribosomal protein L15